MSAPGSSGAIVYSTSGGVDAIDEHSRRLTAAMSAAGTPARYVPDGLRSVRAAPEIPAWVLLEYNPFAYGRWGFAPDLLRDALLLRRRGVPLAIMVHEAWVAIEDAKSAVLGAVQRLQLRSLMELAGVILTSTEALARAVGRDAIHVPIANNITPVATTKQAARRALGLPDGLVVSLLGPGRPGQLLDFAAAAVTAIAASRGEEPTTVLNLGARARELDVAPDLDVRTPGLLADRDLSLHLWSSDMLLLPFDDGLSTRRSSLMAALAHGRPVVGLHGRNTDSLLLEHDEALVLTAAGDIEAFVRAAVSLAAAPARRRTVGDAGRRLYDECFDWPHLARRVACALDSILPPASSTTPIAALA
jgi:hypothetical protein